MHNTHLGLIPYLQHTIQSDSGDFFCFNYKMKFNLIKMIKMIIFNVFLIFSFNFPIELLWSSGRHKFDSNDKTMNLKSQRNQTMNPKNTCTMSLFSDRFSALFSARTYPVVWMNFVQVRDRPTTTHGVCVGI